jgi:hypothetical protein
MSNVRAIATVFAASLFSVSLSAARADDAAYSPLSAFGLEYRGGISARYQDALYVAEQISFKGGNVSAAYAHQATRTFLDSAALPQPSQEARDRYVLFAASSELIAASHESGASAALSRRNAVALLTPLAQPRFEFFVVSYANADKDETGWAPRREPAISACHDF